LRAAGDDSGAAEVAKLKKPTVAASLVNALSHRESDAMSRFLAGAGELEQAQNEALRGRGGEHLRAAGRAQREAIESLVEKARGIAGGASAATLDRVRQTFEAALADATAREAVASGRLQRELRPGGAVPKGPKVSKAGGGSRGRELAAARRELRELKKELREAEGRAQRLEAAQGEAQRRLSEAQGQLREARAEVKKLGAGVRSAAKRLEQK
jgi:hypothetical protein